MTASGGFPVFVGDTITAQAEIAAFDPASREVNLVCSCTSQSGRTVLKGEIKGCPGRFEM